MPGALAAACKHHPTPHGRVEKGWAMFLFFGFGYRGVVLTPRTPLARRVQHGARVAFDAQTASDFTGPNWRPWAATTATHGTGGQGYRGAHTPRDTFWPARPARRPVHQRALTASSCRAIGAWAAATAPP